MRRTKEEAAVTRAAVLKAALAVFSRTGYAAATLQAVAAAARVTRGAVYWHFKSKAELYNTLLQEFSEQGAAVAQAAVAEGGPLLEVLRRVFVRQCALIETNPQARAVAELALFKTGHNPDLQAGRRQQIKAGRGQIEQLAAALQGGVERGELRADVDPATMAQAFIAYQNGLIHVWLAAPQSFSLAERAPAFAELFLSGLRPPPA